MFDDFFTEPYKTTSLARFINIPIKINRFRKPKIYASQQLMEQDTLELTQNNEPNKEADLRAELDTIKDELKTVKDQLLGAEQKDKKC